MNESLLVAEQHGCTVSRIRGTGELKVYSQSLGKMVVIHADQKDTPRRLRRFLVQLSRSDEGIQREDDNMANPMTCSNLPQPNGTGRPELEPSATDREKADLLFKTVRGLAEDTLVAGLDMIGSDLFIPIESKLEDLACDVEGLRDQFGHMVLASERSSAEDAAWRRQVDEAVGELRRLGKAREAKADRAGAGLEEARSGLAAVREDLRAAVAEMAVGLGQAEERLDARARAYREEAMARAVASLEPRLDDLKAELSRRPDERFEDRLAESARMLAEQRRQGAALSRRVQDLEQALARLRDRPGWFERVKARILASLPR